MQIIFDGSCGVTQLATGEVDVYMPTGSMFPHTCLLSVQQAGYNPANTTAAPTAMMVDPAAAGPHPYIAFWQLADRRLSIGSGKVAWDDASMSKLIALNFAADRIRPDMTHVTIVRLSGGSISSRKIGMQRLRVLRPNNAAVTRDDVPNQLIWELATGGRMTDQATGGVIAFEPASRVFVTNVSTAGSGAQHFQNYYDLQPSIAAADRVSIEVVGDPMGGPAHGEFDNCSPPAMMFRMAQSVESAFDEGWPEPDVLA